MHPFVYWFLLTYTWHVFVYQRIQETRFLYHKLLLLSSYLGLMQGGCCSLPQWGEGATLHHHQGVMGGGVEQAQALEEAVMEVVVRTFRPVFWFAIYAMTAGICGLVFWIYHMFRLVLFSRLKRRIKDAMLLDMFHVCVNWSCWGLAVNLKNWRHELEFLWRCCVW